MEYFYWHQSNLHVSKFIWFLCKKKKNLPHKKRRFCFHWERKKGCCVSMPWLCRDCFTTVLLLNYTYIYIFLALVCVMGYVYMHSKSLAVYRLTCMHVCVLCLYVFVFVFGFVNRAHNFDWISKIFNELFIHFFRIKLFFYCNTWILNCFLTLFLQFLLKSNM